MTNWKSVVNELRTQFEAKGGATVLVSEPSEGKTVPVQTLADEHLLKFEGKKLQPKTVRKWLWEQRDCRVLKRQGAVLFAGYDEAEDTTLVGLGAMTSPDAAVRLTRIRQRAIA